MLALLINLLILVVIFGIIWWILSMVPVPPTMRWIVNVIFAVIFLIVVISMFMGAWTLPFGHPVHPLR